MGQRGLKMFLHYLVTFDDLKSLVFIWIELDCSLLAFTRLQSLWDTFWGVKCLNMIARFSVIDRKAFDRISGYINHAKTGPNTKIIVGGKCDDRFLLAFYARVRTNVSNPHCVEFSSPSFWFYLTPLRYLLLSPQYSTLWGFYTLVLPHFLHY